MKRTALILSILAVGAVSYFAIAQESDNTIPPYTPPVDPNAVDGVPAKRCPMCMMMGQSMLQSQIVPLADGGVLLMMGNTLYKYDKDLTLVNQVTVEIDPQQLQSQMQQLMQNCPICAKRQQPGFRNGQTEWQTNGKTDGQTNGVTEEKSKSKTSKPESKADKANKEQY